MKLNRSVKSDRFFIWSQDYLHDFRMVYLAICLSCRFKVRVDSLVDFG